MNTYTVSENGFSIDSDKVQVPACRIQADSYVHANEILDAFLSTGKKPDAIELITPIERIDFKS